MTDPGGPRRRGRHASSDDGTGGVPASYWTAGGGTSDGPVTPGQDLPGYGAPRYEPSRYEPPTWGAEAPGHPLDVSERSTGGFRRVSGLLDRVPEETGPVVEPDWWAYGSSDHPDYPVSSRHGREDSRHGREDLPGPAAWDSGRDDEDAAAQGHPSAPLPARPAGVWDRFQPRENVPPEDAPTVAQPLVPVSSHDRKSRDQRPSGPAGPAEDDTDAHPVDPRAWEEQTGGLEVIGAHVEEDPPRRRRRWRRRHAESDVPSAPAGPRETDAHGADLHEADLHEADAYEADLHEADPYEAELHEADPYEADLHEADDRALIHDDGDEDIPVKPYDPRGSRRRRRRRPFAVLVSLLVLVGLVFGIVVGGQRLLEMIDPTSRDYTGEGSGTVQIRVSDGDTLSDIARTLVDADVIASIGPFVDAAEANTAAVGIQPGVYAMRQQMSGQAALDLLLDPVARLVSRVTLPEGLTVERTLARLAQDTGRPIEELQAAVADPAALGLPAYANGQLEGFLFPATYDFEPDAGPADMLREMVSRAQQALDELQIPEDQRLTVLTKASLVQAEAGSAEDMGKVARVLENRLADGMPLQLDTTVNYANGKGGLTTTPQDRSNPSPYNTYEHPGLPPGAIANPGEEALRAVLSPTPGDWRFFVVVDPDTGDTRFAVTGDEHDQNVALFRQWLQEHPEG